MVDRQTEETVPSTAGDPVRDPGDETASGPIDVSIKNIPSAEERETAKQRNPDGVMIIDVKDRLKGGEAAVAGYIGYSSVKAWKDWYSSDDVKPTFDSWQELRLQDFVPSGKAEKKGRDVLTSRFFTLLRNSSREAMAKLLAFKIDEEFKRGIDWGKTGFGAVTTDDKYTLCYIWLAHFLIEGGEEGMFPVERIPDKRYSARQQDARFEEKSMDPPLLAGITPENWYRALCCVKLILKNQYGEKRHTTDGKGRAAATVTPCYLSYSDFHRHISQEEIDKNEALIAQLVYEQTMTKALTHINTGVCPRSSAPASTDYLSTVYRFFENEDSELQKVALRHESGAAYLPNRLQTLSATLMPNIFEALFKSDRILWTKDECVASRGSFDTATNLMELSSLLEIPKPVGPRGPLNIYTVGLQFDKKAEGSAYYAFVQGLMPQAVSSSMTSGEPRVESLSHAARKLFSLAVFDPQLVFMADFVSNMKDPTIAFDVSWSETDQDCGAMAKFIRTKPHHLTPAPDSRVGFLFYLTGLSPKMRYVLHIIGQSLNSNRVAVVFENTVSQWNLMCTLSMAGISVASLWPAQSDQARLATYNKFTGDPACILLSISETLPPELSEVDTLVFAEIPTSLNKFVDTLEVRLCGKMRTVHLPFIQESFDQVLLSELVEAAGSHPTNPDVSNGERPTTVDFVKLVGLKDDPRTLGWSKIYQGERLDPDERANTPRPLNTELVLLGPRSAESDMQHVDESLNDRGSGDSYRAALSKLKDARSAKATKKRLAKQPDDTSPTPAPRPARHQLNQSTKRKRLERDDESLPNNGLDSSIIGLLNDSGKQSSNGSSDQARPRKRNGGLADLGPQAPLSNERPDKKRKHAASNAASRKKNKGTDGASRVQPNFETESQPVLSSVLHGQQSPVQSSPTVANTMSSGGGSRDLRRAPRQNYTMLVDGLDIDDEDGEWKPKEKDKKGTKANVAKAGGGGKETKKKAPKKAAKGKADK